MQVRSSFVVPHTEIEGQFGLDMPFHQQMVDLLHQNGTKEELVGWYATSPEINSFSGLVQNHFSATTAPYPAVHLTVDTGLSPESQSTDLGIKGWVSSQLGLNPKPEHCVFLPVPVQVKISEGERAAIDHLTTQKNPSAPSLVSLSSSLDELSTLIEQALEYVKAVNSGSKQGDADVGRYLLEGLGRWSGAEGEQGGVKAGLQDSLTVSYLSNLIRTQVELSGRLALVQASQ